MTTVEEGVDLVRAVTEKLSGPQTVWILNWQTRNDRGNLIFASKGSAVKRIVSWLDDEWADKFGFDEDQYRLARAQLLTGVCTSVSDDNDRWYDYEEIEVEQ